ncbi:MAG: hypothetical protein ACE5DX_05335 [Candidatus Dojkabacteria bacterium]
MAYKRLSKKTSREYFGRLAPLFNLNFVIFVAAMLFIQLDGITPQTVRVVSSLAVLQVSMQFIYSLYLAVKHSVGFTVGIPMSELGFRLSGVHKTIHTVSMLLAVAGVWGLAYYIAFVLSY